MKSRTPAQIAIEYSAALGAIHLRRLAQDEARAKGEDEHAALRRQVRSSQLRLEASTGRLARLLAVRGL